MGILTNRNTCRECVVLCLFALVILPGLRPGFAETQDIEQLRQAAEQGHAEAQYKLGGEYWADAFNSENHRSGNHHEAVTWYRKAAEWYRKAADQGHVEAQFSLGGMYHSGRGMIADGWEAVRWYRKAADQGCVMSQFKLGEMYDQGEGVPEDDREAVTWYYKAAEQGHVGAQNNLGVMFRLGQGVPQDRVKAYAWMNVAAALGDGEAAKNKERLSQMMTRKQVAKAQKLSRQIYNRIEALKSE